jgi:hypothetical protein
LDHSRGRVATAAIAPYKRALSCPCDLQGLAPPRSMSEAGRMPG